MSLAFLRFSLASVLLLPFIIISRQHFIDIKKPRNKSMKISSLINPKHWPALVLIGLLIVTFHIFFFYEGLARTAAINASVLSLVAPMFSVLAGWWFLKERIYWINLLGVSSGLIGAVVIVGIPLVLIGNLTATTLIGNLLIICSSVSFVIGAIISKQMLKIYHPLVIISIAFMIGAISFLPLAVIEYIRQPEWVNQVTIFGLIGVGYTTLMSSISAYFLYEWAIKRIGIIRADVMQYLQPIIAASLAVPILNERISVSFIIGTCLIVAGVYWGTMGKSEHNHHSLRHHRV